jgi:phospholipase/lecithinase/hemolysin
MYIVRSRNIVLFLIVIFFVYQIQSENIPYDTIVCFGDSMSDTGNVYNLTDFKWPLPSYYEGRFSNGPVWIEKLTIAKLVNYAYGSATSDNNLVIGVTEFNTVVPGVRQQIAMYKNATDLTKINFDRTIYVIWAGGNDYFFNASLNPSTVVNSLMNGINDIIQIGGTHFLIVNQPPSVYPALILTNLSDYYTGLTLQHNSNLSNSIQTLQSNSSNLSIIFFDIYSLITGILQNSSAYGINNTQNCWSTLTGTVIELCTTPNTYLFIDEYHFTTHVHQIIADNAQKLLVTNNGKIKLSYSIFVILLFFISLYTI